MGQADADGLQRIERLRRDQAGGPITRTARFPVTRGSNSDASGSRAAAESILRDEGPRIVSALIRKSGSFDLAEDALQEAFTAAFVHWPKSGVPRNSGAWIMAVPQRNLIDVPPRKTTQHNTIEARTYQSPQTPHQIPHNTEPTEK